MTQRKAAPKKRPTETATGETVTIQLRPDKNGWFSVDALDVLAALHEAEIRVTDAYGVLAPVRRSLPRA